MQPRANVELRVARNRRGASDRRSNEQGRAGSLNLTPTGGMSSLDPVRCVCVFTGEGISGVVTLTQAAEDEPTQFRGEIKGLPEGTHAFALHEWGDLSSGGVSTGVWHVCDGRQPTRRTSRTRAAA